MLWNEKRHWQTVNIGARVVGGAFIFGGMVFSIWGFSILLDSKATIDVDRVPTTDPWTKAIVLIVGLVFLVLGLLLVFARRFGPDLGDSAFTDSKRISPDKIEKHEPDA
jgi:hypothetical protein